ncbi:MULTISPECIES: hypothetical protein [Gordonia]|uniref:Uncharacterized protein n=3 Tax=Gordonia TaxID=2053 RepID=A0A3G8JM93_9ACTN|nr:MULTISPECIES: hypothetical protein [Gordonia]ASR03224.1 hypothetical protein GCWB2_12135 [Gordonia rubripertincta]AZG45569.1 hypothetical protein D7316_02165 [Gordonia insulae]MDG6782010.1 hypothetical protein [Gordonia rubripertincta]NKY64571.1 hypothetical protein [Gordonia rubripertincta]GAB86682.1 hypothetical protein GORBP_077_01110 [Gordonia rubripertincta NBRC 101908]
MLKTGSRLQSQVCGTQVIIVKAPAGESELDCGGQPMIDVTKTPATGLTPAAGLDSGTQLGKRYVDPEDTVEVLVTKPGTGTLSLGGTPLDIKSAKPLPSSD